MKKVLALLLVGCLSFMPTSVGAGTIDEIHGVCEELAVKSCIEDFFCSFENMDNNAEVNEMMIDMVNISACGEIQKYEMNQAVERKRVSAQSTDDATFLEMVKLLLQRREIIERATDVDLKEYQKTLDITIESADIKGNTADVDVRVVKKWNYAFSPEVESAAEDYFEISLSKESEEWKISKISGLSNVVMDEELIELGDEITCREREEYINALEEEYAVDLESQNFEEKAHKETGRYMAVSDMGTVVRAASGYNNTAAVSYAQKYAMTPNSSYTTFSADCTNFSSQCLYAGGIKQHAGITGNEDCWFYKNSDNRSSTWAGVKEFQRYVTGSVSKIDVTLSSFNSVVPGDMIHLTNSSGIATHALVITGVVQGANGRNDLLVCAHTTNRLNASLTYYYGSRSKVFYHVNGSK